jgi:hypothetical protein
MSESANRRGGIGSVRSIVKSSLDTPSVEMAIASLISSRPFSSTGSPTTEP